MDKIESKVQNEVVEEIEDILKENKNRFVLFPIDPNYLDIWELYKDSLTTFWTADEIDFTADIPDWENRLNNNEKFFVENVLAFFAASDGIVNENLAVNFYNEVQVPEVRQLYATQIQIEAIHSECVTGDTMLLTDSGYVKIGEHVGETINIWNGYEYSEVLIEYKGEREIYTVELSNGMTLECTKEHKWHLDNSEIKNTIDLVKGDTLVTGWKYPVVDVEASKFGLGFYNPYYRGNYSGNWYINKKNSVIYNTVIEWFKGTAFTVPINYSTDIKLRWLEGLVDSNACFIFCSSWFNTYLKFIHHSKSFLRNVQLMLTTMNIVSTLDETVQFNNDPKYFTLVINQYNILALQSLGFCPTKEILITNQTDFKTGNNITVKDIKEHGLSQKTYCFHEPKNATGIFNGIITGQCYSLMIDTYVKNKDKKDKLFKALETNPIVSKKAQWALKWISNGSFAERLLAFGAVEGIFFSGSFCAIFWLKSRGLMPALSMANEFISRDEALHCRTCVKLYAKLKYKLTQERVHSIFKEAYEIEEEFITKSLPVNLIGMNANKMKQYIQFVTDYWLHELGYETLFNVRNPFPFMTMISLENKTNFFEKRVSEYSRAGIGKTKEENAFSLEEDF